MEWVAIIGIRAEGPFDLGTPTGQVVSGYTGHADALAVMAGWFNIVLIGRVLFVIGVRASLARSGRPDPLMDLAVVGMSLGGWMSGVIFDYTGSYAAAFANGFVWNLLNIGIVLILLLRGRRRLAMA